MKKTTYLMIVCAATLLIGGLYYFFRDEPIAPQPTASTESQPAGVLSYAGNSIIEEKDGKRVWEIGAETIDVDIATKNMKMKNIKGIFYQANGGKVEISAPEGTLDSKTKDVVMTGKVRAVSTDGKTFTAQETRWSGEKKGFYGAGNVLFTQGSTVLSGDQIESDANMVKVKLTGHARVINGGASK